jgi:hypothetical protein
MRRAAERLPRDDPTVVGTRMRNLGDHLPACTLLQNAMFCLSGLKKALNFRDETASACPPDTYRLPHITAIHLAASKLQEMLFRAIVYGESPNCRQTG